MQRLSRRKLARGFVELLDRHSVRDLSRTVAKILIDHKQAHSIELFVADVAHELLRRHQHVAATVHTAHQLSSKLRHAITDLLKERTSAQTVTVAWEIDPALKGGFIATTPAGKLDASISRKLNQLKALR